MSTYYRMLRQIPDYPVDQLPDPPIAGLPANITIIPYDPALHHEVVPQVYAAAFGEPPWPADWEAIPEFDPGGVFLAISTNSGAAVGFVVSFMRRAFGYISVVAVVPAWRRQGIASALIAAAAGYLLGKKPAYLRIDVEASNAAAVKAYEKLGFEIESVFED